MGQSQRVESEFGNREAEWERPIFCGYTLSNLWPTHEPYMTGNDGRSELPFELPLMRQLVV